MADTSVKESPCCNNCKILITTSTPHKNINDSGYNTSNSTVSNVLSSLSQISEVSICLDHTPLELSIHQLSSNIHNLKLDHSKFKDSTSSTISDIKLSASSTSQDLSPPKKFKSLSDMKVSFPTIKYSTDNNCFLEIKHSSAQKKDEYAQISMDGRKNVDIIYFLAERHCFKPVTENIFSYLSNSDIISMSMVSKVWCDVIKNSPIAQTKKQTYIKLSKENRGKYNSRNHRSTFRNKGCLADIGNLKSPSKINFSEKSPPVSPNKYRFHVFQKEAKSLSSDQQLVSCPRCSRPASWSPSQSTRAECRGFHCKFVFCTKCMCEYSHNFDHKCLSMPILPMLSSNNCRPLKSKLNKRKHNLRRL